MTVTEVSIGRVLTRAGGFLRTVASHSLQPYAGCAYGRTLCGAGCYVRHNAWLTRGREWGSFLEVRTDAADSYRRQAAAEQRWGRAARGRFAVFMSSSTDPYVPQERTFRVTRSVLEAMLAEPPDVLVLQTHSPTVVDDLELLSTLAGRCDLRVHLSIETDRERLPGLPRALPVEARFRAARTLRTAGLRVVITVSPLLPIADPEAFFARIAGCADGVVLDHFVQGDGTPDGSRTLRTPVPAAMARVDPASVGLEYRDRMVEVARRHMPGRVGVHVDGFAGRFLP